jgi:FtsH-binding integral membrane protein
VDLRRLRAGEWIAGLSGAALVVSLFLPWYGVEGSSRTANAWDALAVNDGILLLVALFAVAVWVVAATQETSAVPVGLSSITALLALLAIVLVIIRLVSTPDVGVGGTTLEVGIWLALASTAGIFLGCFLAMGDERTPRSAAPNIEVTPLPPPRAGGEGSA